jgi:Protein of unknown function (DUF3577)
MESIMSEQQQLPKYFDLHVSGVGYLNRIRHVPIRKGAPFLACTIAALRGDRNEVEYTNLDVKVSGESAKVLVEALKTYVDRDCKVLIGFKVGDIYAESFTMTSGERQGQTAASIKGRLLKIEHVRIDGNPIELSELVPQEPLAA